MMNSIQSENLRRWDAELGSDLLAATLRSAGLEPTDRPTRALTFEEQLAAVERGARIVTVLPIRKADPDITLGGVSW